MAAYMWNAILRKTSRIIKVDNVNFFKISQPSCSRLSLLLQCSPVRHTNSTAVTAPHQRLHCSTCQLKHPLLPRSVWQTTLRSLSTTTNQETSQSANTQEKTDELDKLYKTVELRVKGHDDAVLNSYEMFVCMAAKELGVTVESVAKPLRKIKRLTLLKSRHIFKKHRVQYELRTYFRIIELKHLTGSTADVFLEYIERNLPEGVAVKVTKIALGKMPDHLQSPPPEESLESSSSSASSTSSSSSSEDEDENPSHARD